MLQAGPKKTARTVEIGRIRQPQAVGHEGESRASVDLVRLVGELVDKRREGTNVDQRKEGLLKAKEEL